MSLLLDALRKSERQRKLGQVPDIEVPSLRAETPSGRTFRWAMLLLVPLLALAGWWWLAGRDQQVDQAGVTADNVAAANGQSRSSADDDQPVARVEQALAGQTDSAQIRNTETSNTQTSNGESTAERSGQTRLSASVQQNQDDGFRVPQPRTGLPAGPGPQETASEARRGSLSRTLPTAMDSAPQSAASLDELVRDDQLLRETDAEAATAQSSAIDDAASDSGDALAAGAAADDSPTDASTSAADSDDWRPARPEPISYYELPVAVRQELVDFRVTIRIYNEDPAQRFAVINQQRFFEGDEVGQGMRLVEIRRDGVVFEYEQYRFLLP